MFPDAYVKTILSIWSERCDKTSHTVEGNCMAPMIREGDCIFVAHGRQSINVGDVVVAGISGSYKIERVIRKEAKNGRDTFLLKGDQSSYVHESVFRSHIIGKVVEVSGSNGHLYLDSFFWKSLNYLLFIRSIILVHRMKADTPLWKVINTLFTLRAAVFPGNYSLSLIPFRCICFLSKRWFQMRKCYFTKS
jgi:hypothetical protein